MINWKEIESDKVIHGLVNSEVVFKMTRKNDPPYVWEMSGLLNDRSQYRNDLKERAEMFLKTNQ